MAIWRSCHLSPQQLHCIIRLQPGRLAHLWLAVIRDNSPEDRHLTEYGGYGRLSRLPLPFRWISQRDGLYRPRQPGNHGDHQLVLVHPT
jgi:hypothetical protein